MWVDRGSFGGDVIYLATDEYNGILSICSLAFGLFVTTQPFVILD